MHYRLGSISLAATTLLLSLTSPLLPLGGFEPLAAQAQTTQNQKVEPDNLFQTGVDQFNKGQLREALATFQQVLALSRERGDKQGEAEALSGIGEVYLYGLHPRTEALNVLQEALAIYQKLEDVPQTQLRRKQGEARAIALTGLAYGWLNRKDEGLQNLQQALSIQREIGDKESVGKTLNYIANLAISDDTNTDPNRLKEALELLQQALAINREVGNSSNETVSLALLGFGHISLSAREQALKFLNEALAKSRENGYQLWEGQALVLMTLVHMTQGNAEETVAVGQQALSTLKAVESNGTSDVLFLLGVSAQNQQQYSDALEYYQKALAIHREVENRAAELTTLNNIALVYRNQKQYPQALKYYQQALAIARQIDNRVQEGNILNHIGIVYDNQEDYESALSYYQQALAIHRDVKNQPLEIATLNNIGIVYQKQKQYPQAREYYEQALAVAKQTDNHTARVNSLLYIQYTYFFQGDALLQASSIQQAYLAYQQALEYSRTALTIAQNIPNSKLKILSNCYHDASSGAFEALNAAIIDFLQDTHF